MDARAAGRQSRRRNYLPLMCGYGRTWTAPLAVATRAGRVHRPQSRHTSRAGRPPNAHITSDVADRTLYTPCPRAPAAPAAPVRPLSLNLSTAERGPPCRSPRKRFGAVSEAPAATRL